MSLGYVALLITPKLKIRIGMNPLLPPDWQRFKKKEEEEKEKENKYIPMLKV